MSIVKLTSRISKLCFPNTPLVVKLQLMKHKFMIEEKNISDQKKISSSKNIIKNNIVKKN